MNLPRYSYTGIFSSTSPRYKGPHLNQSLSPLDFSSSHRYSLPRCHTGPMCTHPGSCAQVRSAWSWCWQMPGEELYQNSFIKGTRRWPHSDVDTLSENFPALSAISFCFQVLENSGLPPWHLLEVPLKPLEAVVPHSTGFSAQQTLKLVSIS